MSARRPPASLVLVSLLFPGAAGAAPETLTAVVFYDEDGNGRLDAQERVRLPEALVEAAGRRARSATLTGRVSLEDVPPGTQRVSLVPESLPPFYEAGPPLPVQVPAAGEVPLPVTLPIGGNRPNTYMALGDSISDGDGSSDEAGYRGRLERLLRRHFGAAVVINEGAPATDSHRGARRVAKLLARHRPAVTLILYGTNDWDESGRESVTLNSLRRIVQRVKAARSLPFLATLPPTNPGPDKRASIERNRWIERINQGIQALARDERAVLVDLHTALLRAGDPARLYSDGLHPSDAGYDVIAAVFFEAIARRPAQR